MSVGFRGGSGAQQEPTDLLIEIQTKDNSATAPSGEKGIMLGEEIQRNSR